MKGNSAYIEKTLFENAGEIEIDEDFKRNLKYRIMAQEHEERNTARHGYLKVAGWLVFAALTSGTIYGAGGLYSKLASRNNPDAVASVVPDKTQVDEKDADSKAKGGNVSSAGGVSYDSSLKITIPAKSNPPAKSNIKDVAYAGTTTPAKNTEPVKDTAPAKGNTNTQANSGTSGTSTAADDKTNTNNTTTINLTMVAGRYFIQNISVSKTGKIESLPEENTLYAQKPGQQDAIYDKDGNVYMILHATKKETLVDTGKNVSLYSPILIASYIKEDETSSSVWIFDGNSAMKYMVLNSDKSKYQYLNTYWSSDGQKLYVSAFNKELNKQEILELTLDIK